MNFKYVLGALASIPLLPLMYYQGKEIRASVKPLGEATGNEGLVKIESNDDRALKLLCIGESTIAGVGVKTHEEGFSGTLAKSLAQKTGKSIDWKVYAKSGYTAKRIKEKMLKHIEEKNADLIVVGLGANDTFTLNTPSQWRKDITALINQLKVQFPNTPIVFCNMPPIKDFPAFTPLIKFTIGNLVELLGAELADLVKDESHIYFINQKLELAEWIDKLGGNLSSKDFFSDGVHPSKLTYQTWAEEVAIFIDQNLKFQAI
jgi:lysophospholipase L1-like esterase